MLDRPFVDELEEAKRGAETKRRRDAATRARIATRNAQQGHH